MENPENFQLQKPEQQGTEAYKYFFCRSKMLDCSSYTMLFEIMLNYIPSTLFLLGNCATLNGLFMRRLINLNSKHIQWIYEFSKRWVDPIAIPWTKKDLLLLFERYKNAPHLIIKGTECYCTDTKKEIKFRYKPLSNSISPCLVFVPSFVLVYFCFLMLPV